MKRVDLDIAFNLDEDKRSENSMEILVDGIPIKVDDLDENTRTHISSALDYWYSEMIVWR